MKRSREARAQSLKLLHIGSLPISAANNALVMELVYVSGREPDFCEFESHQAHQSLISSVWQSASFGTMRSQIRFLHERPFCS